MSLDDKGDEIVEAIPWPPTQEEVGRWLAEYKKWCSGNQPLPPGMRAGGGDQFGGEELRVGRGGQPDAATRLWMDQLEAFERDYASYERFRRTIGEEHGRGYEAGRQGMGREGLPHKERTHETYSWLNGWAVGNFDYRWRRGEVQLPRSPGVTWPKKLSSVDRYS